MGDQVMWLAPIAAAALVGGLALAVRRRQRPGETGALILWGGWAAATYVVFAFAEGIYHNYYVSALAPAVAALAGIGVALVRRHRAGGAAAVVAVVALATAWLQRIFLERVDSFEWLRLAVPLGLVAVGAIAAAVAVLPNWRSRALPWLVGAGLGVALVPAAVWTWSGTQSAQNGTFPDARPVSAGGFGGGGFPGGPGGPAPGGPGGPGGPAGFGATSAAELSWLQSQQTTERWLLAVGGSQQASGAIIQGYSLMPMGGFSGSDPAMTVARLAQLVTDGQLRFVSAGGGGFGGGSPGVTTAVGQVCKAVSAEAWGGSGTTAIFDCQGQGAALAAFAANNPGIDQQRTGFGGGQFPGGRTP